MTVQAAAETAEGGARAFARLPGSGVPAALVEKICDRLAERWRAETSLLGTMCAEALVPSGKLFRPILLLESALAVGGDAEVVLPAAVGAECGHVASLVHDDIIDKDDLRRGRPSVQHKFGADNAILAGDALIFDLFIALAECRRTGARDDRIVAALEVVARCGIDLCRGQSLEAELCERRDFDLDAYLTVVRLKTATLFKSACECGALLAGADERMVRTLGSYAENLGCAFQIQDDLMSYTREADVMGKPGTSDVRNGRVTLPVILAYQAAAPDDRAAVAELLSGDGDPAVRRDLLVSIMDRTGALTAAGALARKYSENAVAMASRLPFTASRGRLCGFARAAVERER
ncbi:polyprenyl synthetase family protein [Amycolatopsis sp. NPDC054798]